MPDLSSSSSEEIDFSVGIELSEHQPEPEQSSSCSRIQQIGGEGVRRLVMPIGAGFFSANAMYDLLVIVLGGYPKQT